MMVKFNRKNTDMQADESVYQLILELEGQVERLSNATVAGLMEVTNLKMGRSKTIEQEQADIIFQERETIKELRSIIRRNKVA